jgi:hypothetical protein
VTGGACDGDDADLCADDIVDCNVAGDGVACFDVGGAALDLCNGSDDDCDPASADGSEDPQAGAACDGGDGDRCAEGTATCAGGVLTCSDATGTTSDLCNGADDDCDPASADGAEDPQVGPPCDGADGDACAEGTVACSGGVITCSDATGTTTDLCNGLDDDCDPASADGSEEALLGAPCDGSDGDLCVEGTRVCSGGTLACTDTTGTTTDLCNGADDDCDPASADGAEDPQVGGGCDGTDGDLCVEGMRICSAGAVVCGDLSGTSVEACNAIDDDCDGMTNEGFAVDTNPVCTGAVALGEVSGDATATVLTSSSYDERWFSVTVREDLFSATPSYLSATVDLAVADGTDFELFVYCVSCGGTLAGSSTSSTGQDERVGVRRDDTSAVDTFTVLIEVRFYGATVCAPWTLTVTSDTAVSAQTCG